MFIPRTATRRPATVGEVVHLGHGLDAPAAAAVPEVENDLAPVIGQRVRLAVEPLQRPVGRQLAHHVGPSASGIGVILGHRVVLRELAVELLARKIGWSVASLAVAAAAWRRPAGVGPRRVLHGRLGGTGCRDRRRFSARQRGTSERPTRPETRTARVDRRTGLVTSFPSEKNVTASPTVIVAGSVSTSFTITSLSRSRSKGRCRIRAPRAGRAARFFR